MDIIYIKIRSNTINCDRRKTYQFDVQCGSSRLCLVFNTIQEDKTNKLKCKIRWSGYIPKSEASFISSSSGFDADADADADPGAGEADLDTKHKKKKKK